VNAPLENGFVADNATRGEAITLSARKGASLRPAGQLPHPPSTIGKVLRRLEAHDRTALSGWNQLY
jgi:hypothetical protein